MNSPNSNRTSEVGTCGGFYWIGFFCFAIAIIYLLLHYLARSGFPRSMACYLGGASVCAVLHLGPQLIRRWCKVPVPMIGLGLLHLLCLLGWLVGDHPILRIVLHVAGVICLANAAASIFRQRCRGLLPLLAAAGVFALFIVVDAWGGSNKVSGHPLFDEELASGQGDNDLLYHASIAAMLQIYGVPSTGLHGAPPVPYHWGGHWLIGKLCNATGAHPMDFYVTLLVPIFYSVYLSAILHIVLLLYARCSAGAAFARMSKIRFWLPLLGILLLAEHTCFGQAQIEKLGMMLLQFSNQSYIIGLSYLLAAVAAILALHDWTASAKWAWPLTYAIVPPLLFLSGFIKITTCHLGFIMYAMSLYLTGRWRRIPALLSLLAAGASIFWLTSYVAGGAKAIAGFSWFAFYRSFVAPGWLWAHLLAQYWPLLVSLLSALVLRKNFTDPERRVIWTTLAISTAVTLAAQVPCATMKFYGVAVYYTNLAASVNTIPLLLIVTLWRENTASVGAQRTAHRKLWHLGAMGAFLAICFLLVSAAGGKARVTIAKQVEIRKYYTADRALEATTLADAGFVQACVTYVRSLMSVEGNQPPQYRMLLKLKEYGFERASQCQRECVFVPRDNLRYWSMNRRIPWANCFIGPAYSRRCLIFGLPDTDDSQVRTIFGFAEYKSGWEERSESDPARIRAAVQSVCPSSVEKIRLLDQTGRLRLLPKE